MPRNIIHDVRYSLRVSHQLDAKVRAFAKSRNETLSGAAIRLMWTGLSYWAKADAEAKAQEAKPTNDDDLTPG